MAPPQKDNIKRDGALLDAVMTESQELLLKVAPKPLQKNYRTVPLQPVQFLNRCT